MEDPNQNEKQKPDEPDVFRYITKPSKVEDKCIFCKIGAGKLKPGGKKHPKELIYQNETVAAFGDMKPGAVFHSLVITKKHYKNCWEISPSILDEMEQCGQNILNDFMNTANTENGNLSRDENENEEGSASANSRMSSTRMFFIRPPFNSVYHVHLHVMVLPLTDFIFNLRRLGFSSSWFYVTPEELRRYWESKEEKVSE
mmetsp:Transcript_21952/g.32876  ORF Transcript_21952/g.32876 Transcript_21952/m.32876 type:complete len:200 (+) Transcript_21952:84-683(+)